MIEARDLTRRYGTTRAVDGVSFRADEGEILGLLGPNGAGKTTTLRMLTGYLPPTSGSVEVAGVDLAREPLAARRNLGYLPESVALYPEMRVEEYLAYRAKLVGLPRRRRRPALETALERCRLTEVRRQVIGTLSKGFRQRVGLAQAILHEPRVLVLDEPTVGLDPQQIVAIRELVRELGRERTLVLSTHILPEVELLCDRVLIVDRGRIVGSGTAAELAATHTGRSLVRLELEDAPGEAPRGAAERLARVPGVVAAGPHPEHPGNERVLLVEGVAGEDARRELFRAAVEAGWTLLAMAEERASLEEIFLRLTTRDRVAELAETEAPGESRERETSP